MAWLILNFRGINKWYKQKELKNYLKTKNIKLAGIIKTRVKEHNMKRVSSHTAPGWEVLHNYTSATTWRIWLIWDPNYYTVTLIRVEAQVIHCLVKGIIGDQECLLTVVYGYNTIEQRKQLWDNLTKIEQGISKPWLLGGDFNSVLQLQNRLHGNPISLA